jgi:hypothetical protein
MHSQHHFKLKKSMHSQHHLNLKKLCIVNNRLPTLATWSLNLCGWLPDTINLSQLVADMTWIHATGSKRVKIWPSGMSLYSP